MQQAWGGWPAAGACEGGGGARGSRPTYLEFEKRVPLNTAVDRCDQPTTVKDRLDEAKILVDDGLRSVDNREEMNKRRGNFLVCIENDY